jgi:hypothetical protein
MGYSVFPAPVAGSKTAFRTMLTSGTSYTVPAGVTYLNVTLIGGGGGAGFDGGGRSVKAGFPGQKISSTLSTTPGASISYAIGAGGAASALSSTSYGSTGGTTTFTGATSATGGTGGSYYNGGTAPAAESAMTAGENAGNGGYGGTTTYTRGGAGGAGSIVVEYWA